MFYFLLFFLCTAKLFSFDSDPFLPNAPPEKKFSPSSLEYLIGGLVNPATGQLSLSITDLVARGAEPLTLTRHYYPPEIKKSYSKNKNEDQYILSVVLNRYPSWIFLPHIVATFQYIDTKGRAMITITEPDGSRLQFKRHRDDRLTLKSKGPFTNSNGEIVSAAFDARNTHCTFVSGKLTVHAKDGSTRYYERGKLHNDAYLYYLKKERLPNGKNITYSYNENYVLQSIKSQDPKEQFTYASLDRTADGGWTTHTGQSTNYQFRMVSDKGSFVIKKGFIPLGYAKYNYQYWLLSEVHSPLANESYDYSRGVASAQSTNHPLFFSSYSAHEEFLRISTLQLPVGQNDQSIPTHKITYQSMKNEEGALDKSSTTVMHPDGTKTIYHFSANSFSNTIEHEGKRIVSTWDKEDHLSNIELSGLYCRQYQADSYGNPKLEIFIGNLSGEGRAEHYQILREYHKNLLLKETTAAGLTTTYTYLEGTNLITSKTMDGTDGLHLEEHYSYDHCNNLIESTINGRTTRYILRQNHPHLHMIEWIEKEDRRIHLHYDQHGNVSQEDHYDSNNLFVYSIYKEYNERGNLISITNPIGQKCSYTYDHNGNLTSSSKPKESFQYDRRGRVKSFSDPLYTTTYQYDSSDNLLKKTDRFGTTHYTYKDKKLLKTVQGERVTTSTYDIYGREISRTDGNGHTTRYKYNARNQPIEIIYPDNSHEYYRYQLDGKLQSHTDPEGNKIFYVYDSFGRMRKKIYAEIGEETFTYDALYLLSQTDLEGHTTFYFYDELGRKMKEERCGRVTQYAYDSLSRVASTTKGGITTSYTYDLLDRVLEEATPYSKITYTYDEDGNKSSITTGDSTETFVYDALKRLIKQTDPLGNTTTIAYTDFQKTTTDPKGTVTTETYDRYENVLSKEICNVTAFRYLYDRVGNLIREEEDVYKSGQYLKTLITTYAYTSKNEIASITKYGETIHYFYTPSGKVQTKTKADGTSINYTYDRLGYLIRVGADEFVYNKLGYLLSGTGFVRKIDPFGNILKETLANGLCIEKSYDDLDRPLTITLPTGTIKYTYDLRPKTISYKDYTHSYAYNLAGQIISSGPTSYTRDAKGQISKLEAPHISQECTYDPIGNLTYATPDSYAYDELSQLAGLFDSHFDPPNAPITGNLAEHKGVTLTYDAQDRLIQANAVEFTYDALGRRLSKDNEIYLYDGLTEIATCIDEHFYLKVHNVLLDLDGTLAIPVFDATHTLRSLIDPLTEEVLNSYQFDPFGNPLHISEFFYNPYRYALKHYDEETELIYFGKRYYDPSSKRWITPDPAGPIDLINLYVFVRNNPFRYTDYTGFFAVPLTRRVPEEETFCPLSLSQKYSPPKFSSFDQVGLKELQCGGIWLTPGINVTLDEARGHATLISNYAGGVKVSLLHNQTHGIPLDIAECALASKMIPFYPSFMALKEIKNFHRTRPAEEKMFLPNHSGGSIHIRNALLMSTKAERNRVISLSIAPAAIIPNDLCFRARTYATPFDIVVWSAILNDPFHAHEIEFLKSHPEAPLFDHSITSPTFKEPIQRELNRYIQNYGYNK